MKKLNILVVEDGQSQREMLRDFLAREGHAVAEAENGDTAIQSVLRGHFDMILLDYKMPGMDGMQVLKEVKKINPEIDVIIITAYGTIETAVEAMKAGAIDYITKPVEFDELLIHVDRVSERRTLIRENEILRQELKEKGVTMDKIIYQGPKMNVLINMANRIAVSRATVLIKGESGTGKELLARLIHNLSPRSAKLISVVNCSALPESLLESELFGHEKGAFTGATARRIGRFEEADGGTLFLDEIGDISASVQVKAPSLPSGTRISACRRQSDHPLRCKDYQCNQSRLGIKGQRRHVQGRPFLQTERSCNGDPSFERKKGRRAPAHRSLPETLCRGEWQERDRHNERGQGPAFEIRLSRQRPGTGEYHRTGCCDIEKFRHLHR